jgi:Fe2+ or Zn2+ uptake regulation protein
MVGLYRARGYKMTPQRRAIFEVLDGHRGHPTAEVVHAAVTTDMPSVSLRTVYSVLAELVEMGEVLQFDFGTGSARFDPNNAAHHHLVCDACGAVRDVDVDHPDVRPADSSGDDFEIVDTEIIFRGRCATCRHSDN